MRHHRMNEDTAMLSGRANRCGTRRAIRVTLAAGLAGGLLALAGGPVQATASHLGAMTRPAAQQGGTADKVLFKDGRSVRGEILEETETSVKMRVSVHGITTVTVYDKRDILSITRGVEDPSAESADDADGPIMASEDRRPVLGDAGARSVYVIKLEGTFGVDISQTPFEKALIDARKHNASVVIIELENAWRINESQERKDDDAKFDELFRAEDLHEAYRQQMREWLKEHGTQPRVVFWVKRAMGGAAFLPLISPDIYFSSDAKMGGIGNLSYLLGSTGDEVVRQKQYSLRMGHAEGVAIEGGYPIELVHAMAQSDRVFSYRMVNGEPVFVEDYPDPSRGEVLLTDDGIDDNEDTIQALARGEGNDVLTLNARLAQTLRVSDGTVDSIDDLLFALGLGRTGVVIEGGSDRITKGWSRGVVSAERQLRKMWEEADEIQVAGDYKERTRARGQRRRIYEKMIGIIRKYGESLKFRSYPREAQLLQLIEQIKLQQLADKK